MNYRTHSLLGTALTLWLVALPSTRGFAAVICVSPGGGSCETSVQAGIDAAMPGDTVRIDAGRYDENLQIPVDKTGLVLLGNGGIIDAHLPNTGIGLLIEAPDVTLDKIDIRNGDTDLVFADTTATRLTVTKSVIRGSNSDCLDIRADFATVSGSVIQGCDNDAINVVGDGFTAQDNELSYFGSNGLDVSGGNVTAENNTLFQGNLRGLLVSNGDGATITKNKGSGLEGHLIRLSDVTNFVVEKNTVSQTSDALIELRCRGSECTGRVARNSGRDLPDRGMVVISMTDAAGSVVTVEKNKSKRTKRGFVVSGDGTGLVILRGNKVKDTSGGEACFTTSFDGTRIEGNKAKHCGGDGYRVSANNTELTGNKVGKALGNGFSIDEGQTENLLRRNAASGNTGVGIRVRTGNTATTVEDNRALKNREDYCDAGTGTSVTGNSFGTTFDPGVGDCPAGS